ncbi:MAG: nucleotidyltransferase substrate binding protein [Desulfobacterales bacterium]|nr:nucleotidyltransferase substrate binding protein [Desulfobacterales bacterium]
MSQSDIRWIQRFNNFNKAFAQLKEAVKLAKQRQLSNLEELGLNHTFEYTHEIVWNTLKDLLKERGVGNLYGSRDTTRKAFKTGLLENGDVWMDMIKSRNLTSHTYNEEIAHQIATVTVHSYLDEFSAFQTRMEKIKEEQQ